MTRVVVDAGICGFRSVIVVEKIDRETVRITIESECKNVMAMGRELAELNWRRGVFGRMIDSPVYQVASRHLKHTACSVPSAILKAIEVEVGIALPKDVRIYFEE